MSERIHKVPAGPGIIAGMYFNSYFQPRMESAEYTRAHHIFNELGALNERSIAIQLHAAMATDKLEEVLSAYETIMDPEEGFLHLIEDPLQRIAEVRYFADYIYGNVIAEGNPERLFALREATEIPAFLDLMEPPHAHPAAFPQ